MFLENQEHRIIDYMMVAWKRRWLVLTVFLVVFVTSIIILVARTPRYSAHTEVLIERSQQILGKETYFFAFDFEQFTETQVRLMNTEDFLRKVADELNRKVATGNSLKGSDPKDSKVSESYGALLSGVRTITLFFREQLNPFKDFSAVKEGEPSGNGTARPQLVYDAVKVADGLEIKLVPKTEIIRVRSTRIDPEAAALVANTFAEVFIHDRLNRQLASTQEAIKWLQEQLKQEQVDLDSSRIELYTFMNTYGIMGLEEQRGTRLDEELKLLEEKVRMAKESTATLQIRYNQVLMLSKSLNLIDTIPEAMTNKVLSDLRTQEIQLEQEASKLSGTYGSNHPKIAAIERQLRGIRNAKNQEIQKIVNALKVQYETAVTQEKSVVEARKRLQNEQDELKKRTVRYYTLKREVESNEKVYDVVLNRLKEASLTEEFTKSPNASIIQRAHASDKPSSPDVKKELLKGFVLALLAGIGLALLLEYLDNTFSQPDQIEENLGLTFLGAIPRISADTRVKQNGETSVVALTDFQSSMVEAYRALRTSILLSSADVQPQVLMITSPGKGEGKSITAANLAAVMAHAGSRVLLVDCDLRKPKIHKMFGLDRDVGLSSLLVSKEMKPEAFIQKTAEPKLEVLACGPIPPNPSELLGSKRMLTLLEMLRKDYERIILDSPPLLAATDAAVLTPIIDGTVLVLRAGETTRQMAQRAIKLLTDLNARVAGVVLNDLMLSKNGYYYYDYYHYGHYYGEEADDGGKSKRKKRKRLKNGEINDSVGEA
jgi:polysaccharide biosynthesis transport protein